MTDLDAIAAAVVTQLNNSAAEWSPLSFTARFDDAPNFTTDDLEDLTVVVVPNNVVIAPFRKAMPGQPTGTRLRGVEHYDNVICVFVAQKGPAAETGTDPLIAWSAARRLLVQKMGRWFNHRANRNPTGSVKLHGAPEHAPLYDMQELTNNRNWLSMIRLTYSNYERE